MKKKKTESFSIIRYCNTVQCIYVTVKFNIYPHRTRDFYVKKAPPNYC